MVRKADKRRVSAAEGLLSLAVQRLLKRLTCQSEMGLFFVSEFLGTTPQEKGQVGWSKMNHSSFPLSPDFRKSPVKAQPHTIRHTLAAYLPFPSLSLSRHHLSLSVACMLTFSCTGQESGASYSVKLGLVSKES